MKPNKLAILYTAYLRPELEEITIKSILENMDLEYMHLFIGNQSYNLSKVYYEILKNSQYANNIHLYSLPNDCGLSYARNFLVERIHESNINYILLTADSIKIIEPLNKLYPVINFLNSFWPSIIGLNLKNRVNWNRNIILDNELKSYILLPINKNDYRVYDEIYNIGLQKCDVVSNFFLSKTKTLINNPWDSDLKLCLDENTPITIKNGYNQIRVIPIKSLFPHSISQNSYKFSENTKLQVWTDTGWQYIKHISRKLLNNQPLINLSTPSSFLSLTPDHRLIIDNKEIESQQLKIGDKIELGKFPELLGNLKVNNDWAWMLGFFLAEGTCKSGKETLSRIEFTNQNIEWLQKCENIFNSIGIECKWYIDRHRKDKCIFLRISSPNILISYFKEFYYNCGKYNEKIIPYYIFQFDKISRYMFLKGFLDGDGTKSLNNCFAQKSSSIVNGLLYLSQDLDFDSYSINKEKNDYGEWFVTNLKQQKTTNYNILKNIETINSNRYVYDIECNKHHFYAGIGNILVHNCEHETFFYNLKQNNKEVYWTDYYSGEYVKYSNPEYLIKRNRMYHEFKNVLLKKYNLNQWWIDKGKIN